MSTVSTYMPNLNEIYKVWPWYVRYPLALALFLLALFLRFQTLPAQGGLAYVTFYPAVIITFYLFGAGAGTILVLLSGLTGFYFFVPPYGEMSAELKTYISLPYFFLTSFLIGYVITRLHAYVEVQQNQSLILERLRRVYAAVVETDKLISQKRDSVSLFQEVVRIAVEFGGMKMAWIGTHDASAHSIVPLASYGEGIAYLEGISISTRADLSEGRGASGIAFRENKVVLIQDFMHSAMAKPWLERANAHGVRSSACFPVRVDGKTYALLNVYSAEANAFDEETVSLLQGMAADLGHALDEYNLECARQQAEQSLQEAKQAAEAAKNRLEYLLKHSPAVMYSCRASDDFGATFISENLTQQLGYQPSEFIEDAAFWLNHIHPDDRPRILQDVADALDDGNHSHSHEYRFQRKDGAYRWMTDEFAVIRNDDGQPLELVGYWVDVTDARELERMLRFRQFSLDHVDEQVYWIDRDARIIDISQNACQKLGYSREELLTFTVADVDAIFPCSRWAEHWQELKAKGSLRFESIHKTKEGKTYPTEIVANFFEYDGKEYNCALVRDITERKILEDKLKQQAQFDYLTGVSTRGHFMEQAEYELSRTIRYENPLSLMMMDVDYFKRINDTHGHKAGDLVLKKLAEICRQSLREMDIIGRMGGEEFAILLPETDVVAAIEAAERLRAAVYAAKVPVEAGLPIHFTVSIGVSSLTSKEDNIDVLLNLADRALYQAKQAGRNKVTSVEI